MKPEDKRDLLRQWSRAKAPSPQTRDRNWQAVKARIALGDPGPSLPRAGGLRGLSMPKLAALVMGMGAAVTGGFLLLSKSGTHESDLSTAVEIQARAPARPVSASGGAAPTGVAAGPTCRGLAGPYADPSQASAASSDLPASLRQPWRAYLKTLPARTFADGVGAMINFNKVNSLSPAELESLVGLLARHGVRSLLFEIGWGMLDYDTESKFGGSAERRLTALLTASRRHGIRPMIRVYSHEAFPCPHRTTTANVAVGAKIGDRTLTLDDTNGLVPGRSGLSHLTRAMSAEVLITETRGQTVELAQPLPVDLPVGRDVTLTTLKYQPLGATELAETLTGWRRYLDAVAAVAMRDLGTVQAADKGFDIELGNSIRFASRFLFRGRYYDPSGPAAYDDSAWKQLVLDSANHFTTHPQRFAGVRLVNGFVTDQPSDGCTDLPPPFAGIRRATPGRLATPLLQNQDGSVDDPFLWPSSSRAGHFEKLAFPEIEATALISDAFARELAPPDASMSPRAAGCGIWLSGAGIDTRRMAPLATFSRLQALQAKTVLRQYSFFLGKGAQRVVVGMEPSTDSGHGDGLIPLTASARDNKGRLDFDSAKASPGLVALGRLVSATSADADVSLNPVRQVAVTGLLDCHDHAQPRLSPTDAILYNRDVLVVLPFQVSAHRFAIHYYVMTRDPASDLPAEKYSITLGGIDGPRARIRAFDPLTNQDVATSSEPGLANQITVTLEAVDYPRVLIIDEP